MEKVVRLGQVRPDGDDVYWNEGRPADGGRQVIVRRAPDGTHTDVVPEGYSARTLVHEYGGLSYAVAGGVVWFANLSDQRVYRVEPGHEPVPITAEPPEPGAFRYADLALSPDGTALAAVRERHLGGEPVNDVVLLAADGSTEPRVIAHGHDFFAAPRISPDGRSIAWLSWDHPNMPLDGTELWVAPLAVGAARKVAGGPSESVTQPRWSPGGVLHFVSDRTGWWNLYADHAAVSGGVAIAPMEAELSGPDWVFGQSSYCFLPDGAIVAVWAERGLDHLGVISSGAVREIEQPFTTFGSMQPSGHGIVALTGSPTQGPTVVRISLPDGAVEELKRDRERMPEPGYLSVPRPVEFPTQGGRTAHALHYPPTNADYVGAADDRPPLMVIRHGGPTSATDAVLNLGVQYWTSRGFAVADVNYGGSTGYGREYRDRLRGEWGIVDVEDCVAAARWLAEQGLADARRLVIRGGSAGGYTTLAALTFHPGVFAAGASHYGVADLEALATDTHKFESRYLDGLVGPYPERRDLYVARSPIHHADRLSCPLILFQGLEDRVVPPAQAEQMVEALGAKGLPFSYLAFEGEQHGFRQAETIVAVAQAELSFYGRVLGFTPGDDLPPLPIENEDALP